MNHTRHLLIMLACCLIPVALVIAVSAFSITLGSFSALLPVAIALACPLLMFLMMRGMMNEHGADKGYHESAPLARPTRPDAQQHEGRVAAASQRE